MHPDVPLHQIAAEVAAPLAKTDEIIMLSGEDRTTAEVTKLVSQLPPTIQALTGVDLTKVNTLPSQARHAGPALWGASRETPHHA